MATQNIGHCAELPFVHAVAAEDERAQAPTVSEAEAPSPERWEQVEFSSLPEPDPELSIYRKHTIALLRRYLQYSIETGRLPSLVGREFFRSQTSYVRPHTFEDAVHFVIDVEHSLEQLEPFLQQLIARIVLQEYTEEDTAMLLRCSLRTVERRLPEALDRTTEIFLARKIFVPRK